ncbi:MAG: arsenate reductase ArsC [Bacteroidetes bacterium]|jgi:arsenate reductase (thioredoxin)|nr:MAG: protein tyrosine phosphatase [Cryomorphaceae bacterium BACL29 MAG-121220-bin8]MDA1019363.1 arsenate reductase ArsC [Bacteroidota bacterium]|tara:strand:- start:18472 stop:18888 length:417 start_codon:yes stop_codon:yes gene_type:complete
MKNILILCTGNSCRSQIADGYFSKLLKNKANVYSAGIETHGLNSNAVETMSRDSVDISKNTSNNIKEYFDINFDFIITVCNHANENCPFFPSKNAIKIHQNFFDPSIIINSSDDDYDKCRNEIKKFTIDFCQEYFLTT